MMESDADDMSQPLLGADVVAPTVRHADDMSQPLLGADVVAPTVRHTMEHGEAGAAAAAPFASGIVQTVFDPVEEFLGPHAGLMVRERLYLSQVLFGACEKQTQFKVSAWDAETVPEDCEDDHFAQRPAIFQVKEKSECCQRYLCHQFRHLQLGIFPLEADADGTVTSQGDLPGGKSGWPSGVSPVLVMEKPFRCPLVLCCWMPFPFEMLVWRPSAAHGQPDEYYGRVMFDWRWWNCFWPCDQYMTVRDSEDTVLYELYRPTGCGSDCVNCFAPSCCNRTHRTYIRRPEEAAVLGELQNVWPGCNWRGLCMFNSAADNFILRFPEDADSRNKSLLMAGLFLHNFIYWESRENQK
jgi:hypothetical protein